VEAAAVIRREAVVALPAEDPVVVAEAVVVNNRQLKRDKYNIDIIIQIIIS
jgi:hypothetical protein